MIPSFCLKEQLNGFDAVLRVGVSGVDAPVLKNLKEFGTN